MPQTQTEKRETAKRLYVDSGGKITLKEVAEKVGVPPSTLSGWKKSDKWDSLLKRKPRKKKRPGSKGNQRAAKPHPSQQGNKNALKTGRYEELKYATMTDEEKAIMEEVRARTNQIQMQVDLIGELEIRESRMYARIQQLRKKAEEDKANDGMISESATYTQKGKGANGTGAVRNRRIVEDKILEHEHALTAIQKQKQAAIITLHRLTEDKMTREVEQQKMELENRRVLIMERRFGLVDPNASAPPQGSSPAAFTIQDVRRRMGAMSDQELEQYEAICRLFDENGDAP